MNSNFDDLKRAMVDAANTGLQERGVELQQLLDWVAANATGSPVDEIAADLRSQWQQQGWDPLDDETVTAYAEALAGGQRVVVRVEEIQI
jgi:hypothetical protein